MPRVGNNPGRRIMRKNASTPAWLSALAGRAVYVGSGHHKLNPSSYGFTQVSPRPTKSLCDRQRTVLISEAKTLLIAGITKGMISRIDQNDWPKYIWSVSDDGIPFEAKTDANGTGQYHGYALTADDVMYDLVLAEWRKR